ncbi:MAG: GNAT family N-acetyltransferase [Candidatus Thiodiazotropha sp.]
MIRLRRADEADIDALVHLLNQLFTIEQDFTPDPCKQRRGIKLLLDANDAYIVVAIHDGDIIGMATLQTLISTAEGGPCGLIEDVVVDESHRGHGVGKALMKHLVGWAEEEGLTRLQLLADCGNAAAMDFYRKDGWSMTSLTALRKNP